MANLSARLADNVPGEFFVDATCIDCDTCRRVAPSVFEEGDGHSFVAAQPANAPKSGAAPSWRSWPARRLRSGLRRRPMPPRARAPFPSRSTTNVSFCGFTSESSFGAWSYLIERPGAGNVLVDSPRAAGPLLSVLEARGGVATMFLTHRDDVADHARVSKAVRLRAHPPRGRRRPRRPATWSGGSSGSSPSSSRRIWSPSRRPATPAATRSCSTASVICSLETTSPGRAAADDLVAFRDANWYSWPETIRSMERLLDYSFEWVLPGHGERYRAESPGAMRRELERCIAWMKER